jgi:hypothetical protein
MFTTNDVKMFVFPDPNDDHSRIGGFAELLEATAKWIRQYDPEFVETAPVYEDNDFAVCVDWMSLVGDGTDDGAKALLHKLEEHLNGLIAN